MKSSDNHDWKDMLHVFMEWHEGVKGRRLTEELISGTGLFA